MCLHIGTIYIEILISVTEKTNLGNFKLQFLSHHDTYFKTLESLDVFSTELAIRGDVKYETSAHC